MTVKKPDGNHEVFYVPSEVKRLEALKGWKCSSRVQDTAALAKVKVGDKVDITWTEAMLVSLEPEK